MHARHRRHGRVRDGPSRDHEGDRRRRPHRTRRLDGEQDRHGLAVLAKHHAVPCYVAAPSPTIDARTPSGGGIVIEERAADEMRSVRGRQLASVAAHVWNPAFDVTPPALVTSFITERGIERPPFEETPQ